MSTSTLNTKSSHHVRDRTANRTGSHAIIVLPRQSACRNALEKHRRWLARGRWSPLDEVVEPLLTVQAELGIRQSTTGLAAIRMWGQTGDCPHEWVAAADPVYLEAMLDHIRVHAVREDDLSGDETGALVDFLNQEATDGTRKYLQVGAHAYLQGGEPFATAVGSAELIDGLEPDEFLPTGIASREHDRLTGELQLLLHEAAINRNREENGRMPVNSIWFWGGGQAPERSVSALPVLIGDDALYRGFWHSCGGKVRGWPPDQSWLDDSAASFVAVVPTALQNEQHVHLLLASTRRLLVSGRIRRASILYGNSWLMRLERRQMFAFWRRGSLPAQVGACR